MRGLALDEKDQIEAQKPLQAGAAPFKGLIQRLISEGNLRQGDPDLLFMVFFGPLLHWRQIHAVDPMNAVIVGRDQFVRDHVEHFLHGANGVAARRQSPAAGKVAASRTGRSSTRRSRVRARNHS